MSTPDILGSLFKRRGGGTTTAAAAGGGGGGGAGEASALGRSASDEATDAPGRAEVTPLHANKDRCVCVCVRAWALRPHVRTLLRKGQSQWFATNLVAALWLTHMRVCAGFATARAHMLHKGPAH